ncbi:MAG TPA: pyridoxal phosphate-dependent aminotransferase [Solirubrobacteraceae bacterium]|jgi:aspartate/methionine/tyrosine aminotransferase|nr:pyridoxal phosphate-dependent aminotransferase [Solirubrobacteraceae bacterium]
MSPSRAERLHPIPGFGIDRVAAAAGDDPSILRLENLDTDLPPWGPVIEATRAAVGEDDANSYLPFTGRDDLKDAVAGMVGARAGAAVARSHVTITCGEGDNMLDALLAVVDPGEAVVLTDPVYAGMLNRVRLAGGVPRLVPQRVVERSWRLDVDALRSAAVGARAVFLMNPSFPTGAVLSAGEWEAVAAVCREHDLWLVYWSVMEGIVFDGAPIRHPLALEGMAERTIVAGSVSSEWRMIGWRIGWLVGPPSIAADLALVHIYNGLTPGGIAQAGALVALGEPEQSLRACVDEWQRRRDVVLEQLAGYPAFRADGGWSLLVDTTAMGIDPADASTRLLDHGVAATPMHGWGGDVAARHLRIVFSNEPVERLTALRDRFHAALGPPA